MFVPSRWINCLFVVAVAVHVCQCQRVFGSGYQQSGGRRGGSSSSSSSSSTTYESQKYTQGGSASGQASAAASASSSGGFGSVLSDIVSNLKGGNFSAFGHVSYVAQKQAEAQKIKTVQNETSFRNSSWDDDFWKVWGGHFLPGYDISFTEVRIPVLQVNYKGVPVVRRASKPQIIENGIRIPLQYALINLQQYPALEVFFNGENVEIDKDLHDIGDLDIQIDGVHIPVDKLHFPDVSLLNDRTKYHKILTQLESDPGVNVTYLGKDIPLDKTNARLLFLSKVYLTVDGGLIPGFFLPYMVKLDGFTVSYHGVILPLTSKSLNLLNVPGTKLFYHGKDVTSEHNIYDILSLLGVQLSVSGRTFPINNETIGLLGNHGAELTLHGHPVRIVTVGSPERFDLHLADFPVRDHYWPHPKEDREHDDWKHKYVDWMATTLHKHHADVGSLEDAAWESRRGQLHGWLESMVQRDPAHAHPVFDEWAARHSTWSAVYEQLFQEIKSYLEKLGFSGHKINTHFGIHGSSVPDHFDIAFKRVSEPDVTIRRPRFHHRYVYAHGQSEPDTTIGHSRDSTGPFTGQAHAYFAKYWPNAQFHNDHGVHAHFAKYWPKAQYFSRHVVYPRTTRVYFPDVKTVHHSA